MSFRAYAIVFACVAIFWLMLAILLTRNPVAIQPRVLPMPCADVVYVANSGADVACPAGTSAEVAVGPKVVAVPCRCLKEAP